MVCDEATFSQANNAWVVYWMQKHDNTFPNQCTPLCSVHSHSLYSLCDEGESSMRADRGDALSCLGFTCVYAILFQTTRLTRIKGRNARKRCVLIFWGYNTRHRMGRCKRLVVSFIVSRCSPVDLTVHPPPLVHRIANALETTTACR